MARGRLSTRPDIRLDPIVEFSVELGMAPSVLRPTLPLGVVRFSVVGSRIPASLSSKSGCGTQVLAPRPIIPFISLVLTGAEARMQPSSLAEFSAVQRCPQAFDAAWTILLFRRPRFSATGMVKTRKHSSVPPG